MKQKINTTIRIILIIFVITILCGCQTKTELYTPTYGEPDAITVNSEGGNFNTISGELILDIPENALTEQTDLFLSRINSNPEIIDYTYISGYHFGPDGQTFLQPINVKIYYDQNDIPIGLAEEELKLYLHDNGELHEVEGGITNILTDHISVNITHFSDYWICVSSSSGGSSSGGPSSSGGSGAGTNNSSAIYQFEAVIQFHEEEHQLSDTTTRYTYTAYFSWDPSPYVRYYEIKYNLNGNEPEVYNGWGCNWRERGEKYCGVKPWGHTDTEGKTYYLAPSGMRKDFKDYAGGFDHAQKIYGEDKHGTLIMIIHDDMDDDEELTLAQTNQIKTEIRDFIQDYVRGWTLTVRPVAAQSDGS